MPIRCELEKAGQNPLVTFRFLQNIKARCRVLHHEHQTISGHCRTFKYRQAMIINPVFDELDKPETLINHVKQLARHDEPTAHADILHRLIEQVEPLDFLALAFPQAEGLRESLTELNAMVTNPDGGYKSGKEHQSSWEQIKELQAKLDKLKLSQKHFLILSIENVLQLAEKNRWGLCKNHDFIYLYNGTYWAEIDKDTFEKFLGEAAEKMGVANFTARYYEFREKLFKQFITTAYLPTPATDKNEVRINLQNGTFVISPQGTQLRPFSPLDFMTYQLPFA